MRENANPPVKVNRHHLKEELLDQQDERGSEESLEINPTESKTSSLVSFFRAKKEGSKRRKNAKEREKETNHHDSIDVNPVVSRRFYSCSDDREHDPGEDDLEKEFEPAENGDEELREGKEWRISSSRDWERKEERRRERRKKRTST